MPPLLRTRRLLLRPVETVDADFLHAHWNDPDVRRYLWDAKAVSRSTVESVVRHSHDHFSTEGFGLWALCVPGEARPVGVCGLRPVEGTGRVELLYSLEPGHWGRGLATEAAHEVLRYGFSTLGLERIVASADEPNTASQRVVRRLGMHASETLSVDGRPVPYHALTRSDFAGREEA